MSTTETIAPHGGKLVDLLLPKAEAERAGDEAEHLPKVHIGARELSDLEMMAVGALSPLTGFMGEKDYRNVIEQAHLASGLVWTIPVTLSVDEEEAKRIGGASQVALVSHGHAVAIVDVDQIYRRDRDAEAQSVFRTDDGAHPGVKALHAAGDYLVAGEVRVIRLPEHTTFKKYRLTPAQTRQAFADKGWKTVVGFQTRNPVHRAHEYLQKCAMEIVDGLLLHPLVGETKEDDVPADVRMRCYEILFENYYPQDRAMMSVFPAAMRYAGPKEAIWHAICSQELRVHPLHRGPGPRGCRELLRDVRRSADLRRLRAGRARHHPAVLRALVLLQEVRRHGLAQDAAPTATTTGSSCRGRRSGSSFGTARSLPRSSPGPRWRRS